MNNKDIDSIYLEYSRDGSVNESDAPLVPQPVLQAYDEEPDLEDYINEFEDVYEGEEAAEYEEGPMYSESYQYPEKTDRRQHMPNGYRPQPQKKKSRFLLGAVVGFIVGILVVCVGAILIYQGFIITPTHAANKKRDYEDKLELIMEYLDYYYINDLDSQAIEDGLAKGLVSSIGDKYAEYYTKEEFADLIESVAGEYAGIGVSIVMNDLNQVVVYKVFANSPAKESGIQVNDIIVEAAGSRDFDTLDSLVALVRGEPGTTVDIVILRGEEEIPMTIERRVVETETISYEMIDPDNKIGYICIDSFNTTTVGQFNAAIDDLLAQGAESFIMDLRDNPGGDYDAVVAMCDRVVPEGPIVTVEDKLGGVKTDNSDANCLEQPIVLLVNGNSASAAELFTMCLKDYDKAQIVGTNTYGKGIVQSIFSLSDGTGLKFTTERYYGPAGNCIQDVGIAPDYEVEIPEEAYADGAVYGPEDTQLAKALELLGGSLPQSVFDEYYEYFGYPEEATESEENSEGGFEYIGEVDEY